MARSRMGEDSRRETLPWWHNNVLIWWSSLPARTFVEYIETGGRAAFWEDGVSRWERVRKLSERGLTAG